MMQLRTLKTTSWLSSSELRLLTAREFVNLAAQSASLLTRFPFGWRAYFNLISSAFCTELALHLLSRRTSSDALIPSQRNSTVDDATNMTIQALPQSTVRAIGASQVLTDPAAVVKELIDNALDARATSIAIEIHANTLDVIQVRDNGHGIPPPDRPLVARRYCTSKLTNEQDLVDIGGSSLGFRGEALASAAEMSDSMTITTRVEGEQVATALEISQQGEVTRQDRASNPVGTTVKIANFIKSNPVRRQVALKQTDLCLKRIKHMLQAFAFARPYIRLSLRILKAKNDKGNWMYAPKAGGNAENVAFKTVGAACASQCRWSVIDESGFSLQAFLPKPDAVLDKINNIGPFVSVDRRPVTSQRGTPKQIVKMYREDLRKANPRFEGIKDPFIFLEISCPERSYDPNIEPAKDDVLFEEPEHVLAAARKLFAAVYLRDDEPPATQAAPRESSVPVPDETGSLPVDDRDDFVTSLEQQQIHPATEQFRKQEVRIEEPEIELQNAHTSGFEPVSLSRRTFRSNMYGCDEEDIEKLDVRPHTGRTAADLEELRDARNDVSVCNPWIMAKMNALNRPHEGTQTALSSPEKRTLPRQNLAETNGSVDDLLTLPTPRASSPTSPERRFHLPDYEPDIRLVNDGRAVYTSSPSSHLMHEMLANDLMVTPSPSQRQPEPRRGHGPNTSEKLQLGTPLSAIPMAKMRGGAHKYGHRNINRPFISPVVDRPQKEKVWFDHLEGIKERGRQGPRRRNNEASSQGLVQQGEMEAITKPLTPPRRNRDIRDFVASIDLTGEDQSSPNKGGSECQPRRPGRAEMIESIFKDQNENATNNYGALSGRGFVPASELAALEARVASMNKQMAPPPKRRKTGERPLRQISGNAPPVLEDADGDGEYRLEITTRRRSSKKLTRTKSSRLPLEFIPDGKGTYNLLTKLTITPASVMSQGETIDLANSLLGWNQPALDVYDGFVEEQNQECLQLMADKLRELLINKVSDEEMRQDLGVLVKDAMVRHAEVMAADQEEIMQ